MASATTFKSVKNNAQSLVATAPSPATSGTSLVVTAADGTKFPTSNFWATLWSGSTYSDPGLDPNMEVVLVSARSTDTFTITRAQQSTAARSVAIGDAIRLLWTAGNDDAKSTAINLLETTRLEATTATAGGDYALLGSALQAGIGAISMKRGTYSESTNLTGYTLTSKSLYITGEDRKNTIINLSASTSGTWDVKYPAVIQNLTIQLPNLALGANTTGWINISSDNVTFRDCDFIGSGAVLVGACIKVATGKNFPQFINCRFSGGMPKGGHIYFDGNSDLLLENNYFEESLAATQMLRFMASANSNARPKVVGNTLVNTGYVGVGFVGGLVTLQDFQDGIWNNNKVHWKIASGTVFGTCGLFEVDNQSIGTVTRNTMVGNDWYVNGALMVEKNGNTAGNNVVSYCNISSNHIHLYPFNVSGEFDMFWLGMNSMTFVGNAFTSSNTYMFTAFHFAQHSGFTLISSNSIDTMSPSRTVNGFVNVDASQAGRIKMVGNHLPNSNISAVAYDLSHIVVNEQDIGEYFATAASTAATTLSMKGYRGHRVTLSSNTTFTFTEELAGSNQTARVSNQKYRVMLVQDATGSRTVTWPATVAWSGGTAPTLTTTANKIDIIELVWDSVSSKYHGSVIGLNY